MTQKQLYCFFLLSLSFLSSCNKPDEAGKISFILGDVRINGQKASLNQIIKNKDEIETGEKSVCNILLSEKSILQIHSLSKISLDFSDKIKLIDLVSGEMSAVLNKGNEKKEHMVRTPVSLAGVRGTSFFIKIESSAQVFFCTCNGTIEHKTSKEDKTGETVSATHHLAKRFIKESNGQINIDNNPGMLYHTDQDIEELAKNIGVVIDWTKVD
ncbi:MAG: hypothetical protein A2Y41_05605 [Spirochaetes bacterium GWB1_36_13]|nr:MAG: hypothetical protein A2Y41_05605 [Spirochaetes bacterium GWB1_36_13]